MIFRFFDFSILRFVVVAGLCAIAGCNGCSKKPTVITDRAKDPQYRAALKNLATNDLVKMRRAIAAAGTNKAEVARIREAYLKKVRTTVQAGIWRAQQNRKTVEEGRAKAAK